MGYVPLTFYTFLKIMASIRVKFRPSTLAGKMGSIYYQVIHERKVRQLTTDYRIYPHEWDERKSGIRFPDCVDRAPAIIDMRRNIGNDVKRLGGIIRQYEEECHVFAVDEIVDEYNRQINEYRLFGYMQKLISRMYEHGRLRTAETYRSTLNSFRQFRGERDMMLDAISSELIEAYEVYLKKRGVLSNTISFYMRILRAVYNRAVDEGIVIQTNPFRRVYTGVDKTVKRALPLSVIRKIMNLDLSFSKSVDHARDMFLMSFYTRGMSLIDMTFLRKTDLQGGYLVYRRRKTGQALRIAWTREMQSILDKYPENPTQYLFPILMNPSAKELFAYRNASYNINRNLKKVGELAGTSVPLTMYVARHSWASIARSKGVPVSIISEGMGHDSEATTQIYLASIESSSIDRANRLIINSLFRQ